MDLNISQGRSNRCFSSEGHMSGGRPHNTSALGCWHRFVVQLDIRSVERGIRPTAALYLLRVWPFGVTWRHQSRDHFTRNMRFPIGGQL